MHNKNAAALHAASCGQPGSLTRSLQSDHKPANSPGHRRQMGSFLSSLCCHAWILTSIGCMSMEKTTWRRDTSSSMGLIMGLGGLSLVAVRRLAGAIPSLGRCCSHSYVRVWSCQQAADWTFTQEHLGRSLAGAIPSVGRCCSHSYVRPWSCQQAADWTFTDSIQSTAGSVHATVCSMARNMLDSCSHTG